MYRKGAKGWLKHYDFIILDIVILNVAFLLSFFLRHGHFNLYAKELYRDMVTFINLADIAVIFFLNSYKNVLKRGYYNEFTSTFRHVMMMVLLSALYLFTIQEGQDYSRLSLFVMGILYFSFSYVSRLLLKKRLKSLMEKGGKISLLLITTEEVAAEAIKKIKKNNFKMYSLSGLVIIDKDLTGKMIENLPVVANAETAAGYACKTWVDEAFLLIPHKIDYPQEMIGKLIEAGVTIHFNLETRSEIVGNKQLIESMCGYTVLTTSINYAYPNQIFFKRMMDITGGLIGCVLTVVIFILIAPIIYTKSPGPIFFSQERVGKNGRKFKIYKFRSMYMDAEERKKELMKDNRISNGLMFKLDFDPRIIGNKILPDGTKKKGIGHFIRATSLDEFPQFFNVLKGDMSLIGTRPPTIDEYTAYELHHRSRLAIKPGITGLWQVSGRSEITNFEEVVKLDREYIYNWSMGLDLKILLKTVMVVFKREGSM